MTKVQQFSKQALKRGMFLATYMNTLLFVAAAVVLYYLFSLYYIKTEIRSITLRQYIPLISYVEMDKKIFDAVYSEYQKKDSVPVNLPPNYRSPFE